MAESNLNECNLDKDDEMGAAVKAVRLEMEAAVIRVLCRLPHVHTWASSLVQYRARGVATTTSARNLTTPVAACLTAVRARGLQ